DPDVGERIGPVGEYDVLVRALGRERRHELAGVGPRSAEHADLRADAAPHAHASRSGAPTGTTARPRPAATPARAPRPSARTMSPRPRAAQSPALAASMAVYVGTKASHAAAPPCRRRISHGFRAFRNAAHGVRPPTKPR